MINWNETCTALPSLVISHHIWVVPMPRPSVRYDDVLVVSIVVYGSLYGAPRVLDVVEVSPEVAGVDD